jgi:hypothetical protein
MAIEDPTLTMDEFCAAEKISRGTLRHLWAAGKGPRFFRVGVKKLISHEARLAWRRAREAEEEKVSA